MKCNDRILKQISPKYGLGNPKHFGKKIAKSLAQVGYMICRSRK